MNSFNWLFSVLAFSLYWVVIFSCVIVILKENRNPIKSL